MRRIAEMTMINFSHMQMLYASAYRDHFRLAIKEDKNGQTIVISISRYAQHLHMAKAYHSYFTKTTSLSIKIQITIHLLSTDGAIVIFVPFLEH